MQTKVLHAITIIVSLFAFSNVKANDPAYELRRQSYITSALTNINNNSLVIQAYQNQPLSMNELNSILSVIRTKSTIDFDIVKLIRVLCLSNGQYDSLILDSLNTVPFWLTNSDTLRGYWSENHMIMWMSSDWLLHERYGKVVDNNLETRLKHYLRLKNKYGFYEFYSSVYAPYCLSGLLNLADFSADTEIKSLATQAANLLLREMLSITNDKGVYFPAAGRNYYSKYASAYDQNHNNLIYLLTGMGVAPNNASHAGSFLATSSLFVDSIISSWRPTIDTVYKVGHNMDSTDAINAVLAEPDKTIFQWSFGGYFHPEFVVETTNLLTDSNLWRHVDFRPFYQLSTLDPALYPALAEGLGVASKSSVLTGQRVAVFKHNAVTLSSIQDFWKGKLGYQQFPCVANVGTTAVYTASGKIDSTWSAGSATNINEHLPYVEQSKNVALLMYRPEPKPSILPYYNNEVALKWTQADFDEVAADSMWLIGRQQNGYVAVRLYCKDSISGTPACNYVTDGQAWVVIVGDSAMYGNFSNFKSLVHQSVFEEQRYYDAQNQLSVYYAKIIFDTTTIDYAWGIDSIDANGIEALNARELTIYPNPVKDNLSISLSDFKGKSVSIQLANVAGQVIFEQKSIEANNTEKRISTSNYPAGVYILSLSSEGKTYRNRVVKVE